MKAKPQLDPNAAGNEVLRLLKEDGSASATLKDMRTAKVARKEQLKSALTVVWQAFEAGTVVNGFTTKEEWCKKFAKVTIRHCQYMIFGRKANECSPDPNFHPLCAGIGANRCPVTIDWNKEEAWVVVGIEEWLEQSKSKTFDFHSVSGEMIIRVRAQDVPVADKAGMRGCSVCGWQQAVDKNGCFEKHVGETWWEKDKDGKEAVKGKDCPSSGKPTRDYVMEDLLLHTLFKKMKRTLQHMRLWDEAIKPDFDKEVKEMKESRVKDAERRSHAAKRGAETRKNKSPRMKEFESELKAFNAKVAGECPTEEVL